MKIRKTRMKAIKAKRMNNKKGGKNMQNMQKMQKMQKMQNMQKMKKKLASLTLLMVFLSSSLISLTEINPQKEILHETISPIQKLDNSLKQYLSNSDEQDSLLRVIVIFKWDWVSDKHLEGIQFDIKRNYDIIPGMTIEIKVRYLMRLAENVYVKSIWLDQPIQSPREIDPSVLGILKGASVGPDGFVNFTEEIGATELWKMGFNGSKSVIAILDTGVDITGSAGGDLDDFDNDTSTADVKFLGGVSMVPDEPLYYSDLNGRGTFHAGIASGTGDINRTFIGVAPGASYLSVKVFDVVGITYWSFIISGIEWAVSRNADIILFATTIPGLYLDPVCMAINAAVDKGILVVVPVGDDGPSYMSINTPGQAHKAFKVGAYNSITGEVANFSSRGPSYDFQIGPHVIAPGVNLIGPVSRIFSAQSQDMLQSIMNQLSGLGVELPISFDNLPNLSELTQNIPTTQYGEILASQPNYTRASGTGVAAAVVAGAAAVLISAFPLASPELIRMALINGAVSITQNHDLNSEGAGLINLPSAYNWLKNIFGDPQSIRKDLISAPLFYPGFVSTNDIMNVSRYNYEDFGSEYVGSDITALMSSQAMMTALIVSNISDPDMAANFSTFHLPLNQFGLKYNTSENKTEFHWFSEFNVVRELSQGISLNIYQEGYLRYTGVLEFKGIYIAVVIETWAFRGEYNGTSLSVQIPNPFFNLTLPLDLYMFNATDNVNAIQMSFSIINYDSSFNISDVELISFFKCDLFANEYGIDDPQGFLNATYDDVAHISADEQLLYMTDTNSNSSYPYPEYNSISMGYKSVSHQSAGYIIDDSIPLLLNLTLDSNNASIWNSTKNVTGNGDPGFAMKWNLGNINQGDHANFTGVLSVGIGNDTTNATAKMDSNFEAIQTNVTTYNITDVMVMEAEFNRMGAVLERYPTSCRIMNIGNTIINQTTLAFVVNRTNEEEVVETFTMMFTVRNLKPFEIREFNITYVPLSKGIYSVAWVMGDIMQLYNENNPLNNLLARNIYVIDGVFYDSITKQTFGSYPLRLDQAPMTLFGPLDIGVYNITVTSIRTLKNVKITIDGIGEKIVLINQTFFNELKPYDTILAVFIGNPLVPPDIDLNFNISFTQLGDQNPFYRIPVKIVMRPTRGRILFDISHVNLFVSDNIFGSIGISPYLKDDELQIDINADLDLQNFNMNFDFEGIDFNDLGAFDITNLFDLSARFDTIWGGYFDLRKLWADPQSNRGKGASMMCIPPLLSINTSLFFPEDLKLTDLNVTEMVGEIGFLGKTLGNFYFESEVLTTSYMTHDVLQFFDVLVLNKPRQALLPQEIVNITSWVDNGGTLIVLAEDKYKTNINSLNQLLNNFDLEISNNSFAPGDYEWQFTPTEQQTSLLDGMQGTITLNNPVNITKKNSQFQNLTTIEFMANNSIAFGTRGRGKILVIGDANCLDNFGLIKSENSAFAQQALKWALSNYYDMNITASSNIIKKYSQGFVVANITNSELISQKKLTDKGFLFVSAFFYENGTVLNASLYGISIPALPMFYTDGYQYNTFFDSNWLLAEGNFYVLMIVDHPSAAQELFYVKFTIVDAPPPETLQKYQYPNPAYPHWIDVAGIIGILYFGLMIWYYDFEKYKSRLKITQLKGGVFNQAKTILNEAKSMFKIITRSIDVEDVEEVEKIRFLLSQRGKLSKYFKNLKKFGDSIGERYR